MEKGNTATVGRAAERSVPCLAKPATALALADDQVIAFPERRPQKKRRLTTVRKKKENAMPAIQAAGYHSSTAVKVRRGDPKTFG